MPSAATSMHAPGAACSASWSRPACWKRQQGHDKLSTYAIGRDLDARTWRSVFRQLVAA
ncbi:hypothetical protein C7E18_19405, partial [Stenotrophomonas maltophilia]